MKAKQGVVVIAIILSASFLCVNVWADGGGFAPIDPDCNTIPTASAIISPIMEGNFTAAYVKPQNAAINHTYNIQIWIGNQGYSINKIIPNAINLCTYFNDSNITERYKAAACDSKVGDDFGYPSNLYYPVLLNVTVDPPGSQCSDNEKAMVRGKIQIGMVRKKK